MTEADVAEMKAAKEKLEGSAQQVFAKMYEQAQAAAGAQGAGPDPSQAASGATSSSNDDVVDADFKEV